MSVAVVAFFIFWISHLVAAVYAPIQDCDEVFNFWEPTHYLTHGSGLQTWELSPEYAIRSWLYIALHALPLQLFSFLTSVESKVVQFYLLRVLLATACALCEARLYAAISRCLSPRIATFYLFATVFSAGMFHAAASYLSSTFAMYSVILALGSFLDWKEGKRTAEGLTYLAVGTILGWPFVAVLCIPFVIEDLIFAFRDSDIGSFVKRMLAGLTSSVGVLGLEILIDSAFIRRWTSVPFNIVLYNVLSDSDRGPDLYGTEPWHFYFRNLVLNFNVWFLLALVAGPLIFVHHFTSASSGMRTSLLDKRTLLLTSPFYLWLAIFLAQPHKEERFMYPIYPLLAFNAATSLHILLIWLGHLPLIPLPVKIGLTALLLIGASVVGVLRSMLLATAYAAPLSVYKSLQTPNATAAGDITNVCIAKEWYRFPSSYHLPESARLRFLPSAFHGLLPGPFAEHTLTYANELDRLLDVGSIPERRLGTYVIPKGMNDLNKEDLSKYSQPSECDYLVDSKVPSWTANEEEPDYIGLAKAGKGAWEIVDCKPFMDTEGTPPMRRVLWLPDGVTKAKWGDYCLLKRRVERRAV